MDEDDFERLEKLVEDNHRMIKSMHRSMQIGRVFTALYWIAIIAIGFGAYYYVQPFIEPFISTGKTALQNVKDVQEGLQKSSLDIPQIFDKIR
ncbi:MAG: hypothetical protein HYY60_01020 [Parcubacteria group bacterium]|nr:hypothetical protein [Parcubacteria group bacterium]